MTDPHELQHKRREWELTGAEAGTEDTQEPEWYDLRRHLSIRRWGKGGTKRGRLDAADKWLKENDEQRQPPVSDARKIIKRWLDGRSLADAIQMLPPGLVDRRKRSMRKLSHDEIRSLAAWILDRQGSKSGTRRGAWQDKETGWRWSRRWWQKVTGVDGYREHDQRPWDTVPKVAETEQDGRKYSVPTKRL